MREYVLVPATTRRAPTRLARNLATQGIEVRRADGAGADRRAHAARRRLSHVARAAVRPAGPQPARPSQPEQTAEFIDRQEARRAAPAARPDLRHHRLEPAAALRRGGRDERRRAISATPDAADRPTIRRRRSRSLAAGEGRLPGPLGHRPPRPWPPTRLRKGCGCDSVGGAFTLGGRRYPIGTALVRTADNRPTCPTRLAALAGSTAPRSCPSTRPSSTRAPRSAATRTRFLKAPRVLLAWDAADPVAVGRLGPLRARAPLRPARSPPCATASLARVELRRLRRARAALGQLRRAITTRCSSRLKDWLRGGGTLITLAEATRWAAGENVGLLDTNALLKDGRPGYPGDEPGRHRPRRVDQAERGTTAPRRRLRTGAVPARPATSGRATTVPGHRSDAGSIPRCRLRQGHPARAGAARRPARRAAPGHGRHRALAAPAATARPQAMIEGVAGVRADQARRGRNVGYYAAKDRLLASGLIWPEGQDLLVQQAVPHAPALRPGPRHRLRRGPQLPRLHRGHDAAVHERRAARVRLTESCPLAIGD